MKPQRAEDSSELRLVVFCFKAGQQTSVDPVTGYLVLSEVPTCREVNAVALHADMWVWSLAFRHQLVCCLRDFVKSFYAGVVRVGNPSYVFYRDFKRVKDIFSPGKVVDRFS